MNELYFDAKTQTERIVNWIREWFRVNGPDCSAVIGISGGKDSTVAAGLCVKALGPDRVIGLIMPDGFMQDAQYAYEAIEALGMKRRYIVDISETTNSVLRNVVENIKIKVSQQTMINLPARVRMVTLYAFSQTLNGRVVNTCNLSEDYVGYSTKYGDAAGDFAPLKSYTSDEVIQIGRELGLPERLLMKPPSDGLCGKTDEENLGFTYAALNRYIRTGKIENQEVKAKIDRLHEANLFKERLIERCEYTP